MVHRACVNILRRLSHSEPGYKFVKLECLTKLLHSLSNYCQFSEAGNIYTELTTYVWDQGLTTATYPNLAYIYSECSSYHFMKVLKPRQPVLSLYRVTLITEQLSRGVHLGHGVSQASHPESAAKADPGRAETGQQVLCRQERIFKGEKFLRNN